MDIMEVKKIADGIVSNVSKIIIGNEETIRLVLSALFSGGHVLIEDRPGTGKTKLARGIAHSIDGTFKRVQFTPDLMPSDITGMNIYNRKLSEFQLIKGPVFSNVLLADEINRATPRTQSSLLEAMEEKQVTIDGTSYQQDEPFFVIATQNSIESVGTYPLPEAQLDRFALKLSMGDLSYENEIGVMKLFAGAASHDNIEKVCDLQDIINIRNKLSEVSVKDSVKRYILDIAVATRQDKRLSYGVSTRGVLMLMRLSMAYAAISGRDYVTPEDAKYLAPYALGHRCFSYGGLGAYKDVLDIMNDIISGVKVPVEEWGK